MWIEDYQPRKWRPESVEARIYASAQARALANGMDDAEADAEALEAVFRVMSWLYSKPQKLVVSMIEEDYGVDTSPAALTGFWQRFVTPFLAEKGMRSGALARRLSETVDQDGVVKAVLGEIKQRTFEVLSTPNPDSSEVAKLGKLILTARGQDMEKEKIENSMKSKIEIGLDALFEDIKGDDQAEALFEALKEAVSKA